MENLFYTLVAVVKALTAKGVLQVNRGPPINRVKQIPY